MSGQVQRYWKLLPAVRPGDPVAEHDGGVTDGDPRYISGPGNYSVTVRRPGKRLEADDTISADGRPIELHSYISQAQGQPFRFNPSMARWFGLRLIEAAALCEAYDVAGGASASVAPAEITKLSDWFMENAADWIGEGSAVDNAIRLLSEAKRILAETDQPVGSTPPVATKVGDPSQISLRELAIARLRDAARKVIDEQSAPAALELRAVLREAIAAEMVTQADYQTEVLGYFTPNEQTIIRGRVDV